MTDRPIEMSKVHSISGAFVENNNPWQAKYFGGFLTVRTDPDQPRKNVLARPFNGFLIDCYGESRVEGEISSEELMFRKKYSCNDEIIQYTFKLNNDLIWIGEYSGHEQRIGSGIAIAKTNLDWKNIEMLGSVPFNPIKNAEDLVQHMLKQGMIVEV